MGLVPTFRPLRVGEIISSAFNLFGKHLSKLVPIAAVVAFPLYLLQHFLLHRFLPPPVQPTRPMTQAQAVHYFGLTMGNLGKTFLATTVFSVVATGIIAAILVPAIARILIGQDPLPGASISYGIARFGRVAWVLLLQTLLVTVGFICLLVPGLVLSVYTGAAVEVVLLEGLRGRAAIIRSFELVHKNWWHVFGATFLMGLIVGFPAGLVAGLLGVAHVSFALQVVIESLFNGFLVSLLTLVAVILYTDLRSRRDGLSVEQLEAVLG